MTPDINFESLSYSPFSIHENSINSENSDPDTLAFTKIFNLSGHITVPLTIVRTIFNVYQKNSFLLYN